MEIKDIIIEEDINYLDVFCKKGYLYNGVRTASARTPEYDQAMREGRGIKLVCEEYRTTTYIKPEDVGNYYRKTEKVFKDLKGGRDYHLYSYKVD